MRTCLWSLAIVLATLGTSFTQIGDKSVRLHGKVTDEAGARITVATVLVHPDRRPSGTLKTPESGDDIHLQVDQRGEFSVQLAPGLYDVVAFAHIFAPQCAKVVIMPNGPDQRDFVLRVDPNATQTDY